MNENNSEQIEIVRIENNRLKNVFNDDELLVQLFDDLKEMDVIMIKANTNQKKYTDDIRKKTNEL